MLLLTATNLAFLLPLCVRKVDWFWALMIMVTIASCYYHALQCSDDYGAVCRDGSRARWLDNAVAGLGIIAGAVLWTAQVRRNRGGAAMTIAWFLFSMLIFFQDASQPYFLYHSLWHICIGMTALMVQL